MFAEDAEDDDVYFDDDVVDDDADPKDGESDDASAAAAKGKGKSASAKPASTTEKSPAVDPALEALAAMGLSKLREDWISAARAEGVVAVDFEQIGLTGLDEEAKATFIETAKAAEASERARLANLGFVYNPEAVAAATAAATDDAKDAAAKIAWGEAAPVVLPTGNPENDKAIEEAARRGDVTGVIKSLSGLGDFIIRGNRPA